MLYRITRHTALTSAHRPRLIESTHTTTILTRRVGVTPKSKALTPEQQKIQELEARIDRLEREKAILKKATALLMSDEFNRTR